MEIFTCLFSTFRGSLWCCFSTSEWFDYGVCGFTCDSARAGAIVGGSETSSNVLFLNIQRTAAYNIGLGERGFMTVYGSHAVAGGIASAVTPAKINNAVVTINAPRKVESLIMRKHIVVALLLTIATGVLTGLFVNLSI